MEWFKENWLSVLTIFLYAISNACYAVIYFKNKAKKTEQVRDAKKLDKLNKKIAAMKQKYEVKK